MRGEFALAAILVSVCVFFSGCASQESCGTGVSYVCGSDGVTYQNPCLASQAGAKVAYEGMCQSNATKPEALCSDSDGGRNLLQKGSAQVRGQPAVEDFCAGSGAVQENYCEGGELKVATAQCPEGTICEDGACSSDICTDSDNGADASRKGTASKGNLTFIDECGGGGSVIEYFCEGNVVRSSSVECGAGYACSGGECRLKESCVETDAENDIYEKGTVTTGNGSFVDYCTGADTLREYRCSGAQVQEANVYCGSNFECTLGACEPVLCTDSDGGREKSVFGQTAKGDAAYEDTCSGAATVREYYCKDGEPVSTDMECGGDEACLEGRCVAAGCFDSDTGNVAVTAGTVAVGSLSKADECTNLTMLKEYYCYGGDYASAAIDCYSYYEGGVRAVCWMGRCAQTYCTDSDGGRNENVTGSASMTTATGYSGYVSDECLNNRTLAENYCDGNWLVTEKVSCGPEQYCYMSSCVEAACSDTDGGLNWIAPGTVTKGLRTEADQCLGSTTLREWQCDGNSVDYEDHACPAGCDAAGRRCVPL